MTEPYLILHKVRGEPAFDIATRIEVTEGDSAAEQWWIIPTSGHRAYPFWKIPMSTVSEAIDPIVGIHGCMPVPATKGVPQWDMLPDHYRASEPPPPRAARPASRPLPSSTDDFIV